MVTKDKLINRRMKENAYKNIHTSAGGLWHVMWKHYLNQTLKDMRFLSTKVHGYRDYIVGALLIAAPWLFDFDRGGAETWVPVILGISAIIYSLMTDYELGATRGISMRTHLTLDLMSGVFLAASPWIFGFANYVYVPHLVLGIFEIAAALMTRTQPAYGPGHHTHHGTFSTH